MPDMIDPKRLIPSNLRDKIILVRGVPGSGKTLFSNQIAQMIDKDYYNVLSIAADDFFYDEEGNYNYDKSKLPAAHEYCQMMVDTHLKGSSFHPSIIFVHNTFTMEWEMDPYFMIAKENNCIIYTVVVENRHKSDSTHNVPTQIINSMRNRFEVIL
jgi:tRNA uridine 5-carbamoylmethylation protein Kti12|tara:strand:- start:718 stop:1185 length:468 start_codon:yes stop_codon:yes gene_type:complete